MNKKIDISKILAKGSAKQRAVLYFNNIEEKRVGKAFLTEQEEKQLFDSFQSSAEIKLYNNLRILHQYLSTQCVSIMSTMFRYRETIASLSGYCLLYHGYGEFSDTLSGLYFAMETPEEKKKVIDYLKENKRYLWADIGPAEDPDANGIRVFPNGGNPVFPNGGDPKEPKIRDVLNVLSKRAWQQLQECKTELKVLKDKMEETGFKTDGIIGIIKTIENDLQEDKAPIPKFSRRQSLEGLQDSMDQKQKQRMEELIGPDWLFPEYDKVEIDEAYYKDICERARRAWGI